jgi:hypothetical protein
MPSPDAAVAADFAVAGDSTEAVCALAASMVAALASHTVVAAIV